MVTPNVRDHTRIGLFCPVFVCPMLARIEGLTLHHSTILIAILRADSSSFALPELVFRLFELTSSRYSLHSAA